MMAVLMTPAVSIALPIVRDFEGFRSAPYQDGGGVWTIACGATRWNGKPVTATTPHVTPAEADACLADLLETVVARVKATCHVPLSDHEMAALASLGYNIGTGALANSTLMRLLNAGNRAAAAAQFGAWVYDNGKVIRGLQRRREVEKALFLSNPTRPVVTGPHQEPI
jgi:lysozyme